MPKMLIPLLAIFSIIGVLYFVKPWKKSEGRTVTINKQEFQVESADTAAKRTKGLMYRKSLDENAGMLFVFPASGKHSFWMANTYIPLDILWIDSNKKIVHIEENVQPCSAENSYKNLCKTYTPDKPAKYVLEINAGKVAKLQLKLGNKVNF